VAAIVRIVSDVGSTGTTLLDLNGHAASGVGAYLGPRGEVALADVTLAERAGEESFRWSTAVDGGAPSQLASRQITVPFVLVAATADGAAALARQLQLLLQARFVLKLQRHGSTIPAWLRCAPCVPKMSSNVAAAGQPTTIITGMFTTETEAFALGERVDVTAATVTQDPASTAWVLDVNGVTGDSVTPLVLRSSHANLLGQRDRLLITTRRRGVPSSLTGLVVQAEAATVTPGTAPPTIATFTSDATFSGGSGQRATYGTSTSGPWTMSAAFSALTGVEVPGLYRVLVRCRRAGGAAGALFSLIGTVGAQRMVETFTAAGNDLRVIDLGLVQVPVGQPPFMASPQTPTSATGPTVQVTVARAAAGTGTFDVDWIALIPADQDAGMLEVDVSGTTGVLALDGWDHQPRVFSTDPYLGVSPAALGAAGFTYLAGAPQVAPGNNRLWIVGGLGTHASATRAVTSTFSVAASYWPRLRWLA